MVIDTMRGSVGCIKNMFLFSANVITSSDMALFIATLHSCYATAYKVGKDKQDACEKQRALLLNCIWKMEQQELITYGFLFDGWVHFIDFHCNILETINILIRDPDKKQPECKDTDPETAVLHPKPWEEI